MTERKVLNKYFPPDYDPSKIPRLRRGDRRKQFNIRTMAPFNMRCNTCNGYIYKAKKFNSRMETAENVDYLGLRHYRFYIRCPTCCAEIIWRTDLESGDYVLESGAKRNFEALKTAEELEAKRLAEEEEELANNPMKLLEKRTDQSKQEMEMVEVIEDLRQLNQRQAQIEADHVLLRKLWQEEEAAKEAAKQADEELIKQVTCTENEQELLAARSERIIPAVSSDITSDKTDLKTNRSLLPKLSLSNSGKSYLKQKLQGVVLRPKSETKDVLKNLVPNPSETSSSSSSNFSTVNEPPSKISKIDNYSTKQSVEINQIKSSPPCQMLPGMVYSDHSDSD